MPRFRWKSARLVALSLWGGVIGCAAPTAPVGAPTAALPAEWGAVRFYDETDARAAKGARPLAAPPDVAPPTPAPEAGRGAPVILGVEARPQGPGSVLLRWRTDRPAGRAVAIGPTRLLGIESPAGDALAVGTAHQVVVSGLPVGRKVFCRVYAPGADGASSSAVFTVAPAILSRR